MGSYPSLSMKETNIIDEIKKSPYWKKKILREKGVIILDDHRLKEDKAKE